jgi:GMP synthase-like glutamine amidotransferase
VGVGLGHHLLAAAFEGDVGPMAEPEIAVCRVDLTPEAANGRQQHVELTRSTAPLTACRHEI